MTAQSVDSTGPEVLLYGYGDSALGTVAIAESAHGLVALFIGNDRGRLLRDLREAFPDAALVPDDTGLANTIAKATALVDAPHLLAGLPLDLRGSPAELAVWDALRAIPAGETSNLWRHRQECAGHRDRPGGRCRLCGQPHRGRRTVSSGREIGWHDLRLSLGRAAQAPPDQHGRSGVMPSAIQGARGRR